jgi:hypothetical protein
LFFVFLVVNLEPVIAQAAVIYPVGSNHLPLTGSPVTASIYQTSGAGSYNDVTATWLPGWQPSSPTQSVYVVINSGGSSVTPSSINLVSPPASFTFDGTTNPFLNATTLTTSAYRGQCTNYGFNTDVTTDFTFSAFPTSITTPTGSKTGFLLTPNDCGGMAVVQATVSGNTYTFILPQDSDVDGMADLWEAGFGPASGATSLTMTADSDAAPVSSTLLGDGLAAFDEYRGFIVSGVQTRTDPKQKDLFVHLVNPQCDPALPPGDQRASTASLLGGGAITYPTDGTALFDNLYNLIPTTPRGRQIHLLGYTPGATHYTTNEWVDNFLSYTAIGPPADAIFGVSYRSGSDGPLSDRQINPNALYPRPDTVTGLTIQKGVRITECIDTRPSLYGLAAVWGPPNKLSNHAIVFTKRTIMYIDAQIGTNTALYYSTMLTAGGAWTTPVPANRDYIISKRFQHQVAHEIGHSVQLTPTSLGGYHWVTGTGDNLDQTVNYSTQGKPKGGLKFYIPSIYNNTDQANFRIHN